MLLIGDASSHHRAAWEETGCCVLLERGRDPLAGRGSAYPVITVPGLGSSQTPPAALLKIGYSITPIFYIGYIICLISLPGGSLRHMRNSLVCSDQCPPASQSGGGTRKSALKQTGLIIRDTYGFNRNKGLHGCVSYFPVFI